MFFSADAPIGPKFKDFNSFVIASLQQIYTSIFLNESLNYEIKSFASIYLENNKSIFTVNPSPQLAQASNINKFKFYQI